VVRIKALLRAGSRYLHDVLRRERNYSCSPVRSAQALGGERFFLVLNHSGLLRTNLSKHLLKTDDQIDDTPHTFHRGVEIIPERVRERSVVLMRHPDAKWDALLRHRASRGQFKVGMSGLSCDAAVAGRILAGFPPQDPAPFLVDTVGAETGQIEQLQRVLRQCRDQGVSILVLPELRMPPNFVQTVAEFLREQSFSDLRAGRGLLMVAAGSWHVRDQTGEKWVNRVPVLDHSGKRIWEHDKLARYHITGENVQGEAGKALAAAFGLNERGGVEGIETGEALQFCETSIGRVAAAICVGYFHKELEPLLMESRAEVFLVPAMSPTTTDLASRAGELLRSHRACTFVANCGSVGKGKEGASFYQTPLAKGPVWMTWPSEEDCLLHIFHFQFTSRP
jgi:predicted amidohydrolase